MNIYDLVEISNDDVLATNSVMATQRMLLFTP